jgi:hypothetical protein
MANEVQAEGIQNGGQLSPQVQDNSTPMNDPVREEMLPKSRVNELVHERTREASQKAFEKGRSEALAEYQRQNQSMGGMPQMTQDQMRQMMADVFKQQHSSMLQEQKETELRQYEMNLAQEVLGKIRSAKERFPELEKRVEEIAAFPELVPLVNATEDAAAVFNDLLNNPQKIASFLTIAQRSPQVALNHMHKLAHSLKVNQAAASMPEVNEPLGQIEHSNIGMDSGSSTLNDLRKADWLRG